MDIQAYDLDDEEVQERRRQRRAEMKRKKQEQERIRKIMRITMPVLLVAVAGLSAWGIYSNITGRSAGKTELVQTEEIGAAAAGEVDPAEAVAADDLGVTQEAIPVDAAGIAADSGTETGNSTVADSSITADSSAAESAVGIVDQTVYAAEETAATKQLGDDIISEEAILIAMDADTVLGKKDAYTRINPASMTKILTILVAAEQIQDLDDTFTMTVDITDYCYVNDCSSLGLDVGETVPVRDLFYGAILPSGGEAALGLATYVSGSQEEFMVLMNEKLEQLGLSDTAHFTNCIGLYDEDHYCTIYDMAIILEAAVSNDFCKEVLSTHTYTTTKTTEHPEGITVSNWFLRRIEDKETGGDVLCAKTGYVIQSGNCAASYAVDSKGRGYVCATANATSGWRCIYDHVAIYEKFL